MSCQISSNDYYDWIFAEMDKTYIIFEHSFGEPVIQRPKSLRFRPETIGYMLSIEAMFAIALIKCEAFGSKTRSQLNCSELEFHIKSNYIKHRTIRSMFALI